ncbi:MAG: cell division protein SepF [Ruminococcus sp.]|nr:cell division protein SepF [Ruminococcus sp.]
MGVMNGFKSLFFGEEEIEAEEYAQYRPQQQPTQAAVPRAEFAAAEQPVQKTTEKSQTRRQSQQSTKTNSYSTLNSGAERGSGVHMDTMDQSSFDLVLARPNGFKEVEKIGTDVNEGKTVVLNLELVKQEDSTRILDFLWGVAFANNDEIKMLAQKTYAIIPQKVHYFSNVDLATELENNGYNF